MSTSKTHTIQLSGLRAEMIDVEVDISNGLHNFSIIGLGDRSVEESKDRVSAAIKNSGYVSPKQKNQKVVISLAPADMRKEGPSFDLAIALGYLNASGEIEFESSKKIFIGELSLEGKICKTAGILAILCQASSLGIEQAFIPESNKNEASLAKGIEIFTASSLKDVIDHLTGIKKLHPIDTSRLKNFKESSVAKNRSEEEIDMSCIKGNESAKRALEIAAAGGHNVLLYGPPGTGKTMLARSFRTILPNLSYEHSIEVTSIHSIARTLGEDLIIRPPFRSPHHTSSHVSIVGGGTIPQPGEITLAHRGVLFMDECAEFDKKVLESLRQPLEERKISISRAKGSVEFPAQIILLASMNPCPCGRGKEKGCVCPEHHIKNYWRKLSGPIMDRIDIWISVSKVDHEKLSQMNEGVTSMTENSSEILERVVSARQKQAERFIRNKSNISLNSEMGAKDINELISIEESARKIMLDSAKRLDLSGRAFHRILKVAQTITDLDQKDIVGVKQIMEALQYRIRRRD